MGQDVLAAINISEKYIRATFPDSFESKPSPGNKIYDSFEDVERHLVNLTYWFTDVTGEL